MTDLRSVSFPSSTELYHVPLLLKVPRVVSSQIPNEKVGERLVKLGSPFDDLARYHTGRVSPLLLLVVNLRTPSPFLLPSMNLQLADWVENILLLVTVQHFFLLYFEYLCSNLCTKGHLILIS